MRALLDGVFEAEEGFQEVENDEEFQTKEGDFATPNPFYLRSNVSTF